MKDQFHVKGVDTTMGYVGWIGGNCGVTDGRQTHKIESQITKEFLSVGAVLYCKVRLLPRPCQNLCCVLLADTGPSRRVSRKPPL